MLHVGGRRGSFAQRVAVRGPVSPPSLLLHLGSRPLTPPPTHHPVSSLVFLASHEANSQLLSLPAHLCSPSAAPDAHASAGGTPAAAAGEAPAAPDPHQQLQQGPVRARLVDAALIKSLAPVRCVELLPPAHASSSAAATGAAAAGSGAFGDGGAVAGGAGQGVARTGGEAAAQGDGADWEGQGREEEREEEGDGTLLLGCGTAPFGRLARARLGVALQPFSPPAATLPVRSLNSGVVLGRRFAPPVSLGEPRRRAVPTPPARPECAPRRATPSCLLWRRRRTARAAAPPRATPAQPAWASPSLPLTAPRCWPWTGTPSGRLPWQAC